MGNKDAGDYRSGDDITSGNHKIIEWNRNSMSLLRIKVSI